jgi:DNA-binding XRE family transcriptional regulator
VLRNLKAAITVAGYDSQGQFAKDISVSRTTMSNIINENVENYSAKIVRKILLTLRAKVKDEDFLKNLTYDYIFLSDCPKNRTA